MLSDVFRLEIGPEAIAATRSPPKPRRQFGTTRGAHIATDGCTMYWSRLHRALSAVCIRLLRDRRGVTSVEYGLILIGILLAVAGGYRALGAKNATAANDSTQVILGGDGVDSKGGGLASNGDGIGSPGGGGGDSTGGGGGDTPACDGVSCNVPGKNCFVAGTTVATPSGERAIESLAVGDLVFARGESDDAVTARPVLRTFAHGAPSLVDVRLETANGERESIRSTPEHPYWTLDRGWVPAGELLASEPLLDRAGREIHVTKVAPIAQEATVYNIEVEADHTYFVGHTAVWVHNTCETTGPVAPQEHGVGAGLPYGFENPAQFQQFGSDLHDGFTNAGYPDATAQVQGSGATGVSFGGKNPDGTPRPFGPHSDYDVAVISPDLLAKAKALDQAKLQAWKDGGKKGKKPQSILRGGGTRTGPLHGKELRELGLNDLANEMEKKYGREVNFMAFQDAAAAGRPDANGTPTIQGIPVPMP